MAAAACLPPAPIAALSADSSACQYRAAEAWHRHTTGGMIPSSLSCMGRRHYPGTAPCGWPVTAPLAANERSVPLQFRLWLYIDHMCHTAAPPAICTQAFSQQPFRWNRGGRILTGRPPPPRTRVLRLGNGTSSWSSCTCSSQVTCNLPGCGVHTVCTIHLPVLLDDPEVPPSSGVQHTGHLPAAFKAHNRFCRQQQ